MRLIGHLDMNAFFAAVEERDHPELRGQPIVVGADPAGGKGRGATANNPARKYGIHSAQPISQVWKAAEAARRRGLPPAVFVRGRHRRYSEVSDRIKVILHRLAQVVEKASIDEAYFDLSFAGFYERAAEICRQVKREIKEQENLTGASPISSCWFIGPGERSEQ